MAQPAPKPGLRKLIQFFIELAQDRGYANVRVVVKKGQIEMIHIDRSYTLDELPVKERTAAGE